MVAAGVEKIVEIDRLMRAMEIADAEMHDAGAKVGALEHVGAATPAGRRASAAAESLTLMIWVRSWK